MHILSYFNCFKNVSGYYYSGCEEVAECWVQFPHLGVSGEDVVWSHAAQTTIQVKTFVPNWSVIHCSHVSSNYNVPVLVKFHCVKVSVIIYENEIWRKL